MRVLYQDDIGLGVLICVLMAPLRCCYKSDVTDANRYHWSLGHGMV